MAEVNNLEHLTNQIYQEGVEKAEIKSKDIIEEAEKRKEALLKQAEEEANQIISEAKKESARIHRSIVNELNLKGDQFMSDLKGEINNVLSEKIIDKNVEEAFADVEFFKSLIKESVGHWKELDELEVTLSQSIEMKMRKVLSTSIIQSLPNLSINFSGRFDSGFRIAKKGDSYQISFGEEDFKNLFRSYLTEQVNEILFNKDA